MKKLLLFIVGGLHVLTMQAQDPQFSQYYSAPLLLNPAFTGAVDCYRAGINARSQWVGLERPFTTGAVFMDMSYPELRSGFGLMALHDDVGLPRLSSNEVSGFYSYFVQLSDNLNLRFGLQGTYVSRNINYDPLIFEDQFRGTDLVRNQTGDQVADDRYVDYFRLSSGMLLYSDNLWIGLAGDNLNQPDQSFSIGTSELPIKYSVHGGYSISLGPVNRQGLHRESRSAEVIPTFLYKGQTTFDQLDVGMYYMDFPIMFGAWYRGLFLKETEGVINQDALNFQFGYKKNDLSFIYSYDYTISKLQNRSTHGAHEISVIYTFCWEWPPRKKGPKRPKLPCPDL